ncbi:MAG: hypothetical protein O2979_11785, partial [Proteobacteria bacterium]|nr:hypothetical protein [Pseudomonadota bacterium]
MPRLDWLAQLAAGGHAGASELLERILAPDRVNELLKLSPERVHVLAARVPVVAALLALRHAGQTPPDLVALTRWLSKAPPPYPAFAIALREVQAAGSFLGEADIKWLRSFLLRFSG